MFPPLGLHDFLPYSIKTEPDQADLKPFREPSPLGLNVGMVGEEGSISNYTYVHFILKGEVGLETQTKSKVEDPLYNWNFKHDQNCQGFMCVFANSKCVSLQFLHLE